MAKRKTKQDATGSPEPAEDVSAGGAPEAIGVGPAETVEGDAGLGLASSASSTEPPQAALPAPVGRPTIFSQEMADLICSRLSCGESLRSICRDDAMPHVSTVMGWVFRNSDFFAQYRAAREMQAELLADELLEIADDANNDWMERHGNSPGYRINGEAIQRSSLRINTRQWVASRLLPKRWGDKQQVTHQNPDGTPVGQPIDPRTLSPEAREALKEALQQAMAKQDAVEVEYTEGRE